MTPEEASSEQRFDFDLDEVTRVRTRPTVSEASAVADEQSAEQVDLAHRVAEVAAAARGRQRTTPRKTAALETRGTPEKSHRARREIDTERAQSSPRVEPADDSTGRPPGSFEEEPEALSIAQFYERVRRALVGEFTNEVWVAGEIRGIRESKGHRYIELADVGAETVGRRPDQQLEVVCWARQWPRIAEALAGAGVDLEVGRVIRVRGQVSVWEGAGKLRFTLTALDVEALLGGIAAARRRLLLALEQEGLLESNRRLGLSLVPLRVGVVASPGSEGQRDFVGQLQRSGFAFVIHLEPSLVQGSEAPQQLSAALRRLENYEIDLAVVVRGGGARGDLAAFDSEEVARAIATASFPIWTGIGHTGDRSVADEVAQFACITPTACGEAIVARVTDFWQQMIRRVNVFVGLARARLDGVAHVLQQQTSGLGRATNHELAQHFAELDFARHAMARATNLRLAVEEHTQANRVQLVADVARRTLGDAQRTAARHRQVLRAYDPRRQLERGWSLTRLANGTIIRSVESLEPEAMISTVLADGTVTSIVQSLTITTGDHENE